MPKMTTLDQVLYTYEPFTKNQLQFFRNYLDLVENEIINLSPVQYQDHHNYDMALTALQSKRHEYLFLLELNDRVAEAGRKERQGGTYSPQAELEASDEGVEAVQIF